MSEKCSVSSGKDGWLIGYPAKLKGIMVDRKVINGVEGGHFICDMDNTAAHGTSGGPLLDESGTVVGIMSHSTNMKLAQFRKVSLSTDFNLLLTLNQSASNSKASPSDPHPKTPCTPHLKLSRAGSSASMLPSLRAIGSVNSAPRQAGLSGRLDAIEMALWGQLNPEAKSLTERITAAEEMALGAKQSGALGLRVVALEDSIG